MPHTWAASSQYTGALSRIHVRVSWGSRAQNSPATRSTSALVGWSARRVMAGKSDTASGIVPWLRRSCVSEIGTEERQSSPSDVLSHNVERHPRGRTRRIDRELGSVAQSGDARRLDAPVGRPVGPLLRGGGRIVALDPRCELELVGAEPGEVEQQVRELALGVDGQRRRAGEQGLLDEDDAEPVLPEPVMPTITPCLVRWAESSS